MQIGEYKGIASATFQITAKSIADAAKYRIFYKTGKGSWTKLADTTSTDARSADIPERFGVIYGGFGVIYDRTGKKCKNLIQYISIPRQG